MTDDPSVAPPVPDRLSAMPLSAPVWLWAAYGAVLIGLGVLAGSVTAAAAVVFAALFSFQFWTFACWRGLHRSAHRRRGPGDASAH